MFNRYTILILLLLLIPEHLIYIHYVLSSFLIIAFCFRSKPTKNKYVKLISWCAIFVFLSASIRWFFVPDSGLRDFTEFFRFVPILLIFAYLKYWDKLEINDIINAVCLYVIINGIVSIIQFYHLDIFGIRNFVATYYNSDYHLARSYIGDGRILGLYPGPGQHGTALITFLVVLFLGAHLSRAVRFRSILCSALVIFLIMISQSQTAFIAMGVVGAFMIGFVIVKGTNTKRFVAAGFMFLVGTMGLLVSDVISRLGYLRTLFRHGLERRSYSARVEKWNEFLDAAAESAFLFPIGWGKDFFGQASAAMDNEYLFILLVYGAVLFSVLAFVLLRFMFASFVELKRNGMYGREFLSTLFFCVLGGLVVAWPTSFFLRPATAILLAILLMGTHWEQLRLRNRKLSQMSVAG